MFHSPAGCGQAIAGQGNEIEWTHVARQSDVIPVNGNERCFSGRVDQDHARAVAGPELAMLCRLFLVAHR